MSEIELKDLSIKENTVSMGELEMGVQQVGGFEQETDPTVPAWAKQPEKPKYDYSEIENTPNLEEYAKTEETEQIKADLTALDNKVDEVNHTAVVADQNATNARQEVKDLENTLAESITSVRTECNAYSETLFKATKKPVYFDSYSQMIEILNKKQFTDYNGGQDIHIRTSAVPDLWIYGAMSTSKPYTYTNDINFVNELKEKTIVQVGCFMLAELESKKEELTEYAKTEYVDGKIGDIETALDGIISLQNYLIGGNG